MVKDLSLEIYSVVKGSISSRQANAGHAGAVAHGAYLVVSRIEIQKLKIICSAIPLSVASVSSWARFSGFSVIYVRQESIA